MTIHKEGTQVILTTYILLLFITVSMFLTIDNGWIFWTYCCLLFIYALFTLYFFRKPNRIPHIQDGVIMSPADGEIVIIEEAFEGEYLQEKRMQVSIFMSVFNVHINWFPLSGVVEYFKHHNGHFHVAWHPKSSELNERTTIVVNQSGTKILFRQIAGLIARRIVSYAKVGTTVDQCSEAGFIKFGSRVDLFLPLGSKIEVVKGQKVRGCRTVIARLP